jgi:hypothetical protein
LSTFITASPGAFSVPRTNYPSHLMTRMSALACCKISMTETGNMLTGSSKLLQLLPVSFGSPLSISVQNQLPHYRPIRVRRTKHMPCYPRAPVCLPSSMWTIPMLSSFLFFSAKEYLMSECPAEATHSIPRFHVSMTSACMIVVQAYLGAPPHTDVNVTKDDLKKFPLAK